ncbi:hypothetical protein VB773_14740 [Haloarculaceae archaeon H-GB2-1]|nr:hypothetical protein [Haloarculaceae archaeon H-GB1-1]MEA5387200.1 hypothetical protein [Haloarculaceae archaeon H-GB11]MEA5408696.1 hypothetical protein [Haloarculaceae archaeon H-GB2-1]
MTRDELAEASDRLEAAADVSTDDESRDRLSDIAGQLDRLAEAERGPDHGRMARWQTALNELKESAGEDAVEDIDEAKSLISSYREGVAGV